MGFKHLNLTLLYVEDDAATRKTIGEVLALKVQNLYLAKDGVEALEIFKKNRIQLVLSDYQMPNMNGAELCSHIKEINSSVSFILLTAYNDTTLLIDAINSGVDKFLQKPIESKKLFGTLENAYEKIMKDFELEKLTVCLQEAEDVAKLSYWSVDIERKKIMFSQEAKELFTLSGEDIEYKDFLNYIKEEDRAKFLEIFQESIYIDKSINEVVAIKIPYKNISYINIATKGWRSSVCGTKHVVGLFQDVTNYEVQKLRLLKEIHSDPMLNIANKSFLKSELENLIKLSKRYGHSIGVIFFDIDNFKSFNDNYGHLVADDLLVELADLIKQNIRQSDLFGRWGGDEFVLVCGYSSQDASIELANKIRKKVATHNWRCKASVTVSMGLAFYKKGDDASALINRADSKMYKAKKNGKNRVHY